MEFRLTRASESNGSFLFELHRATMGEHVARTWGWDEEWQRQDFEKRLRECQVNLIEVRGTAYCT